jgi:hypothetical protein
MEDIYFDQKISQKSLKGDSSKEILLTIGAQIGLMSIAVREKMQRVFQLKCACTSALPGSKCVHASDNPEREAF